MLKGLKKAALRLVTVVALMGAFPVAAWGVARECGLGISVGQSCNVYYQYYTSVMGVCQADDTCKPANIGTKFATCNDKCLWHRSAYTTELPSGETCTGGTCDCGTISFGGYAGATCVPTATAGSCGTGSGILGQRCDDNFGCITTTSPAFDALGCGPGMKCTCNPKQATNGFGQWNPTCQLDASCSTPAPTPTPSGSGGVSFSPNSFDFGTITLGQASTKKTVTISNTSVTSYVGCVLYSTRPDVFVISGATNCNSLPAGGSCNFSVTASPGSTSAETGQLSLCCGSGGNSCPLMAKIGAPKSAPTQVAETLYSGGRATLKWLESALFQSAGACTVPTCPATNHCDCVGSGWATCGFASQQACYCAVGYNPAVNCGPASIPSGPTGTFTSGTFRVTGASSGAAVCFAGYNCGPCPLGDVCTYDAVGNCCINQTKQVCLVSWSTCTAPVTPTPAPVGTPATNCFASGGVGRKCGTDADCCSGLKCMVAGHQPVSQHPGCTDGDGGCTNGVNYYMNFATNFDWMEADLPRSQDPIGASNGPRLWTSGPLKMCVNPTGGKYPVPAPYVTPAQLMPKGSGHDPAAMVWDNSFGFKCKLTSGDPNRNPDSKICACKSGPPKYVPALILPSEFSSIASVSPMRQKREVLWSLVQRALQKSPELRQELKSTRLVPEARAQKTGSCPVNTCASVTCPSGGSKLYFGYSQDLMQFITYAASRGGTFPASSSTCTAPWNGSTTNYQNPYVICSNVNPSTAPAYFGACSENSSLGTQFYAGLQPASWACGMDLSIACPASATPTPNSTPTKGSPKVCQHGDICGNASLTGVWDGPNNTCCGGVAPFQVCIAPPITCYSSTTPTPTPTPSGSTATPTPIAGTPVDLYAAPEEGFNLYGTSAQNWGFDSTGPVAESPLVKNGTLMVACVKACPSGVSRKTSSTGSRLLCDCFSADPTKPHYDATNNLCLASPYDGAQMDSNNTWVCPPGYDWVPNNTDPARKCRPKLPSNEFTRNADGYPVCTTGSASGSVLTSRIAVQYGASSMSAGSYSGSELPLYVGPAYWTSASMQGIVEYRHAKQMGSAPNLYPFYLYSDQTHCYCANAALKSPPLALVANPNARVSGLSPDTYDVITKQTGGFPDSNYGMVAVHKNSSQDGRLGAEFAASNSVCACPNVNEVPTAVSATEPRLGVVCAPPGALKTDPNRAFTLFDPVKDATFVINPSTEPRDSANNIQKEISLPASVAAPNSMVKYARRIHKCQIGYVLDKANSRCVWDPSAHQCDSTSPLPARTRENQAFPSWSQIVNKRVACCTNDMDANTISSSVKFDCVDNTAQAKTATFNELWAADPSTLGGQLNAVVLSTGNYQPLTGWYTHDGRRCMEFSEFSANQIIPGTVAPFSTAGQKEVATAPWLATGAPIPMPSGPAFDDIVSRLGVRARAPNPAAGTALELNHARRCPLLVRAALITRCPSTPTNGTNAPRFTVKDANNITRCPSADVAQVQVRVEQVFRIVGEPQMAPVDTVLDQKSASTLNVGDIIRTKNGGKCLPGMMSSGSLCKY